MDERIRLGTVSIGPTEWKYINEVLEGGYVSPGDLTKQFEEAVARAHNKKYGLALNSGQSALMVVLEAASKLYGIKSVAVPAITYISSVAAAMQAGLHVRLVDVAPTPEAPMLFDDVPADSDAVMPCHLFGRANDFTKSKIWQNKFICEDACESIYAPGIGMGDAICLSFYPSHTITAGFGGMILTDDEDLYFKCWQLVNHGRQDMDDYTTCHTLRERFTFSEVGYSLKFSDLNAALGLAQHESRQDILRKRRNNGMELADILGDFEQLIVPNEVDHTFMMFPIIVKNGGRDQLEKALNDANIETRRMMPITTQPVIKKYFGEGVEDRYPNAKYINENGLYIGCHQDLTGENLSRIITVFCENFGL